jgi:TatA/E family protein of Tat protein translocase
MGSLSLSEILTIMVVILVIFGPQRLPELARRLGHLVAKAREATASFKRQMEAEYGDAAEPIRELRTQIEGARRDITGAVTGIAGIGDPAVKPTPAPPPDGAPGNDEGDDSGGRPSQTDAAP